MDSWLSERPIKKFTPHLIAVVSRRSRSKSIYDAISNCSCMRNIQGAFTVDLLCDYVQVWEKRSMA
jgi:hypothetical protein